MGYVRGWLFRKWDTPGLFGNVAIVAFFLVQVLDGIFTYRGLNTWGIGVEANLLVAWVMSVVGVGLGLAAVKFVSVVLGALLHLRGLHNAISLLIAIYLVFAVIPWAYLFLTV